MIVVVTNSILHGTSLFYGSLFMLQKMWYRQLQGNESTISCAFWPYSPKLVNKLVHPVQEEFEFLIFYFYLTIFYLSLILKKHFWRLLYFNFLQFWGVQFNFGLKNKGDCSSHKSALSWFCCIFSVFSWTFMSLPVSRGVCSLYLILFSLLDSCIYSIYRPSVSLVLCEWLNVMVVCLPVVIGLLFILVLPWNACTYILASACFSQLLHNITVFDCHVYFTSASLSLYLV